MDKFDDAILSVLQAVNIDEEALRSFTRDDIKDLFPGHENFFRRKKLWDFISQKFKSTDQDANTCHQSESNPLGFDMSQCQPQTSTLISYTADKKMKMPDPPEYVMYTDSELDIVRSQYFALLHSGKEKDCKMSKELCCRLVRNTVTSMVAILRASPMGKEVRYSSKLEMRAMSQKIVDYYPMLHDADTHMPYLTIYTKLYKRLQNMKSPRKRQGSMPQRGRPRKTLFSSDDTDNGTEGDLIGEASGSSDYTILLESNDDLSEDNSNAVDFTVTLFNALPSLFPSPTTPPKRLGSDSEALLHILKPGEDAMLYLEKRPLSSPVLLFDGTTSIVAVGNIPVTTLPLEDFWEGMLVLMAYYYTLHLAYPKCVATVLSVIQTEVITDAIHDRDTTSAYKKAIAEWKSFFEK
ncbi:transcription initiation factor TFIID subunit 6 [Sarotherodon galilaeus]